MWLSHFIKADLLNINIKNLEKIIKNALAEDVGGGDITTLAILHKNISGNGEFLVKQDGIIAGLEVLETLYKIAGNDLKFVKHFEDGSHLSYGQIVAEVTGNAATMLTLERTALNFLQRMSGIATMTGMFVEQIKHTKAKILDTRKTVPGLRELDKLAVKIGGGTNHRIGLYDMFLIKDNHIAVAGSVTKAIQACKGFKAQKNIAAKIEVETTNLDEVKEALNSEPDFIMLDNFKVDEMKKAVKIINGRCLIEASGGIDLNTIREIAETGVDFISVGALTHSVKALDISLEIKTN
jgi:nicotinate-nucleotide pyrophosphorylase (carboxylating)